MIEYHLSEEQHNLFWDKIIEQYDHGYMVEQRIELFNNTLIDIYKLTYYELNVGYEYELQPGFWGTLFGDEKHINWFLLQL